MRYAAEGRLDPSLLSDSCDIVSAMPGDLPRALRDTADCQLGVVTTRARC